MKKQNFNIIYGPSNSGKTTFIKDYCSLYETVNVFCVDTREWKRYNTFNLNDLDFLKYTIDFANSVDLFDDMGITLEFQWYISSNHQLDITKLI